MTDYVTPQVEAAAKSMRTEADVRELARAKVRAWDALMAHRARSTTNLSVEERADLEIEGVRLGRAYVAANDALANAI